MVKPMSKLLWIVAAVVVIVAAILLLGGGAKTNAPTSSTGNLPAVTADNSTPDAIVDSLTAFDSETATTPVESDPSLTSVDAQAMSDLNGAFDPNQVPN
jgi:hypothetical protein